MNGLGLLAKRHLQSIKQWSKYTSKHHRDLHKQSLKLIKMTDHNTKYILVTGGVISGVGKGVIASSFGTILKCCGIHVTSIKIDPYINIDAGTFSPYEHGKYTAFI